MLDDEPLTVSRFTWMNRRLAKTRRRPGRSSGPSHPIGWDDGPQRRALERLSAQRQAREGGKESR